MPYVSTNAEDALRRRVRRMSDAELIATELATKDEPGHQYSLHHAAMNEMATRVGRRTERYEALGQRICESYSRIDVINVDLGLCRNCENYQKVGCPFPDAPYAAVIIPFRPLKARSGGTPGA